MLRVEAGEAHNLKIVRLSQKGVESAVAGAEKDKDQTKNRELWKDFVNVVNGGLNVKSDIEHAFEATQLLELKTLLWQKGNLGLAQSINCCVIPQCNKGSVTGTRKIMFFFFIYLQASILVQD